MTHIEASDCSRLLYVTGSCEALPLHVIIPLTGEQQRCIQVAGIEHALGGDRLGHHVVRDITYRYPALSGGFGFPGTYALLLLGMLFLR